MRQIRSWIFRVALSLEKWPNCARSTESSQPMSVRSLC
jgi:hypothetical protein